VYPGERLKIYSERGGDNPCKYRGLNPELVSPYPNVSTEWLRKPRGVTYVITLISLRPLSYRLDVLDQNLGTVLRVQRAKNHSSLLRFRVIYQTLQTEGKVNLKMNNDHLISNVFNILFTVHPAIARCIL
jgi:hypothetical protein